MSNKNSSIDFLICAISLAAITALFFLHPAGSSDIFWQMKAGETMWNTGKFLSFDPFSFTMQGKPWANFEWLAEIVFYGVFRLGGFSALSILSFATGLLLAAVLFLPFLKISGSRIFSLFLVFSVFFIGAPRFGVLRPEIFGFLFFAVIFGLLFACEEKGGRRVWLCPIILALWANIHPGVILGLLLVSIYLGKKIVRRRATAGDFVFAACCILAPAANPLGFKVYSLPFRVLGQGYAMDVTSDWAAPSWFSGEISFAAWGLAILAAIYLAAAIARRRFYAELVVAAAVFSLPVFFVSRFIPFAAIAWSFFAVRTLSGITVRKKFQVAAIVLCAVSSVLMIFAGPVHGVRILDGKINIVLGPPAGTGLDETDFPVAAADFIADANLSGEIFNDMAWGGYLIWRLWPARHVFIDTRTHLYGDVFIKEYADALFNEDAFKKVAKKYNIGCVIYDKRQIETAGGPLKFLSDNPQWRREYDMGNAAVFLRR